MAKAKAQAVEAVEQDERELLIRIEHYNDDLPEKPTVYQKFRERMAGFNGEVGYWKTAVLDSVTYMELAARLQAQYVLNPGSKEPRQWFAHSTECLEQMLLVRFGGLRLNIVVLAHVDEDKDEMTGAIVRSLKAPGRMRSGTGSGYMEVYRSIILKDGDERLYALQTRTDNAFAAATQIDAPDPCKANYEALWANWGGPRLPLHVLNYANWGSGKSTFAATFPKPMVVWMFDPLGKHFPYLKQGGAIEEGEDANGIRYTHVYDV